MATRIQQFPHSLPGAPGPHTTSYLQLTDTPGAFVAEAIPAVNAGGTAMAFSPNFRIAGAQLRAVNASGPMLQNLAASFSVPTLIPDRSKPNAGIGVGPGNSIPILWDNEIIFRAIHVTGAVNRVSVAAGATGVAPEISAEGTDTNLDLRLSAKGTGDIAFSPNGTDNRFVFTDKLTGLPTGALAALASTGPALVNENPSTINPTVLVNKTDVDTGLGGVLNSSLNAIVNGSSKMQWGTSITTFAQTMAAAASGGPSIRNATATVTGPVFNPHSSLTTTGIGGDASNNLSMINLGVESGRFDTSVVADDMRFMLHDVTAGTLKRVSRGAVDSESVGFRSLRVAN